MASVVRNIPLWSPYLSHLPWAAKIKRFPNSLHVLGYLIPKLFERLSNNDYIDIYQNERNDGTWQDLIMGVNRWTGTYCMSTRTIILKTRHAIWTKFVWIPHLPWCAVPSDEYKYYGLFMGSNQGQAIEDPTPQDMISSIDRRHFDRWPSNLENHFGTWLPANLITMPLNSHINDVISRVKVCGACPSTLWVFPPVLIVRLVRNFIQLILLKIRGRRVLKWRLGHTNLVRMAPKQINIVLPSDLFET